jgi:glycosyltransferase involved in cell wall biosynthesis
LRIPLVLHVHFGRIPAIETSNTWEWRAFLSAARRSIRILVLDKASAQVLYVAGLGARTFVLPNGILLNSMPPKPVNRPAQRRVLFVGWVIPSKGIGELITAWQRIASSDWQLRIAGPVTQEYAIEIRLRAALQDNSINVLGELPHDKALQEIADCDIFVLPSHTEGFPYVILEAMAYERPIVATCVGAIPDMLCARSPMPCGIIVEPKQVEPLAAALWTLMRDPEQRNRLGACAKDRVHLEYSMSTVMDRLVELWAQIAINARTGKN